MTEAVAPVKLFYEHATAPLLVVICGTAGVGKDSVVRQITADEEKYAFVVTCATRPKRPEEVDGQDYWFMSEAAFLRLRDEGRLLEHAWVYDHYKGIRKDKIEEAMASGKDVILRLDVQGAARIRALFSDALLIFITTRTEEELYNRLKRRGTETEEQIHLRLQTAYEELERLPIFDYVVYNAEGALDSTVNRVRSIIENEHYRVTPRQVNL